MNYTKLSAKLFYNMMACASNNLENQKEFVNSLNVFPVPDGDTGTNMSMTFKDSVKEIENMKLNSLDAVSKKLSRGALMGARGNSGVILSQILRGISKGFENIDEATIYEFSEALLEGAKSAYKAVMKPTEGTILTVIKSIGETAIHSRAEDLSDFLDEICRKARITLDKTPEMLPILKKNKVVDAGGMGLLILFEGMREALNIEEDKKIILMDSSSTSKGEFKSTEFIKEDIKFGYCTEFLINANSKYAEDFKSSISIVGDSIVVVGHEDIIKVHVHTNDPGEVLSKALKLGSLTKIKIDNMREQHRHLILQNEAKDEKIEEEVEEKEYSFISVASGKGIKTIFEDLGIDFVINGGQTMNPSSKDILDAINKINAKNIFILPNNKNIVMASEQAKNLSDKNIVVIPTKTIPQGINAITNFDESKDLETNIKNMNESLTKIKSGSVTYAVRDTEIDGKEVKAGNFLGIIEDSIKEVGTNPYLVCESIIDAMTDEESELITIFYGEGITLEEEKNLVNKLQEKYDYLDIQNFNGEQSIYSFIVSVE